jgi:transcriptional regulator with XRE-family HTH domain
MNKNTNAKGNGQGRHSNRLLHLRLEAGLSKRMVAVRLHTSRTVITRHENGSVRLTPYRMRQYSILYDVAPSELFIDPTSVSSAACPSCGATVHVMLVQ